MCKSRHFISKPYVGSKNQKKEYSVEIEKNVYVREKEKTPNQE